MRLVRLAPRTLTVLEETSATVRDQGVSVEPTLSSKLGFGRAPAPRASVGRLEHAARQRGFQSWGVEIDVLADPARLRQLELPVSDD